MKPNHTWWSSRLPGRASKGTSRSRSGSTGCSPFLSERPTTRPPTTPPPYWSYIPISASDTSFDVAIKVRDAINAQFRTGTGGYAMAVIDEAHPDRVFLNRVSPNQVDLGSGLEEPVRQGVGPDGTTHLIVQGDRPGVLDHAARDIDRAFDLARRGPPRRCHGCRRVAARSGERSAR